MLPCAQRVRLSLACLLSSQLGPSRPPLARATHPSRLQARHPAPAQPSRPYTPTVAAAAAAAAATSAGGFMALTYPQPLVIPAAGAHSATVLLLHGLGDTAAGWADVAEMFSQDPALSHVKFVLPTAPQRPITLNGGMRMTGWYDILSLDKIDLREDTAGINASREYVEGLLQAEQDAGVPPQRVLVAGFSQGGAVALAALRSPRRLAGVVGLSTYLLLSGQPPLVSPANQATPCLMCHGTADQVVLFEYGEASQQKLKDAGVRVEWHTFPGLPHSANVEELDVVRAFIKRQLPAQ